MSEAIADSLSSCSWANGLAGARPGWPTLPGFEVGMSSTKWFQFGIDPQFDEAVCAFEAGDFVAASESFRAALEQSKNPIIRTDAKEGLIRALQKLVELKFQAEDYSKSLDYLSEAIHLADSYPDLWFRKGLAHAHLGDEGNARAAWKRAIELNPDFDSAKKALAIFGRESPPDDEILGVLGHNMLSALASTVTSAVEDIIRADEQMKQGRFSEAASICESVLIRNPNFADVRQKLAIALMEMGKLEDAVVQFDHAIAINPRYADAHAQRGIALKRLMRPLEAREAFSTALECNPNHPIAAHELGRG